MHKKEIKLIKNNQNRDWEDIEWVREFYEFLQGNVPEGIQLGKGGGPRLSKKKAFSVIWYLQEHFPLLPDQIEQCSVCGDLYNSYSEGYYSDVNEKGYCSGCDHLAPKEKENT
jgi:hypothetical protein